MVKELTSTFNLEAYVQKHVWKLRQICKNIHYFRLQYCQQLFQDNNVQIYFQALCQLVGVHLQNPNVHVLIIYRGPG